MNFQIPNNHIYALEYDAIVSIGNKCPTTMILKDLHIYRESYPFDFVPTTPKLILKYLKDTSEFFPCKNQIRTDDEVWFGHYNLDENYTETIQTFKRRFARLFTALEEKKKILFVYTTEADVYNEMGNRYNDNYAELVNIRDYIKTKYEYDNFTILAIHTNKVYENTENIINFTINVDAHFCSDNMESHVAQVWDPYRDLLKKILQMIFRIPMNQESSPE